MIIDNAFLEYLGVQLVDWREGHCELALDIGPAHLNRQSSLQGGVIATLLDAACGYAGLHVAGDAAVGNAVTVMLTISYVRKVDHGRIRALGHVVRTGRSLYFAAADLITDDDRLIATAQGTFKRSAAPS
jgi:uncharacterized protein (TIGR00369 family)